MSAWWVVLTADTHSSLNSRTIGSAESCHAHKVPKHSSKDRQIFVAKTFNKSPNEASKKLGQDFRKYLTSQVKEDAVNLHYFEENILRIRETSLISIWHFCNLSLPQAVTSFLKLFCNFQWWLQSFSSTLTIIILIYFIWCRAKIFWWRRTFLSTSSINYLQEMLGQICKSLTSWDICHTLAFISSISIPISISLNIFISILSSFSFGSVYPSALISCFSAELFNINCIAWQREWEGDR